ncbi:PilZ domain-containing protein [Sphingomonas jinjuensis]|uniref:PilZ domain-containing protein n=1 Tax=Sphingomonas jinjuensis TaxID=535907 RepID=UPI0031B57439
MNTSVGGFMARTEAEHAQGERVSLILPVVGEVDATIRWALGGRIGCQFDRAIEPLVYRAMLTALQR